VLKFQGIKLSENGLATAHNHGHLNVGTEDLTICTTRIRGTISACLKDVGAERAKAQDDQKGRPWIGRFGAARKRPISQRADNIKMLLSGIPQISEAKLVVDHAIITCACTFIGPV
jgi:hypothetical protein